MLGSAFEKQEFVGASFWRFLQTLPARGRSERLRRKRIIRFINFLVRVYLDRTVLGGMQENARTHARAHFRKSITIRNGESLSAWNAQHNFHVSANHVDRGTRVWKNVKE